MRHEQIGRDEIFVGNTHDGAKCIAWLHACGVSSARLGETALDIEGKKLSPKYRPIIIARSDAVRYDTAMTTRAREGEKA